jgi:hypothetical protein
MELGWWGSYVPSRVVRIRASVWSMRIRITGAVVALALSVPVSVMALDAPAEAVGTGAYYSSCKKLNARFPHGVAKSRVAALKQVRAGYGLPKYGTTARSVYSTNYKRLDRDRDGTACER